MDVGCLNIDSLDGIRDPGSYTRDSFDTETLEVLQGPAGELANNPKIKEAYLGL